MAFLWHLMASLTYEKTNTVSVESGNHLNPLRNFTNNPEIIYVFRHKSTLSSSNCIFYNSLIKEHIHYIYCSISSEQT